MLSQRLTTTEKESDSANSRGGEPTPKRGCKKKKKNVGEKPGGKGRKKGRFSSKRKIGQEKGKPLKNRFINLGTGG